MDNIVKDGRKWIAETDASGDMQRSGRLPSKKLAQEWIESKVVDATCGDEGERLMSAAIVKGLMEGGDGTRYFGSTVAYSYHHANAVKRGYITESDEVTACGLEWYERCLRELPKTRQVFWTSGIGLPANTKKSSAGIEPPKVGSNDGLVVLVGKQG